MHEERHARISSHRVYDGKLVKVDLDRIRGPSGTEFDLEIVRHPGAAAIVPLLSDPQSPEPAVLLIEQYRYAAGGTIWEVPAGVLEPGEHLTTVYTTPGFTDERIHIFLATGLTVGDPDPEADEFIKTKPVPLAAALEMIRDGEIVDAKSIVALLYVAGYCLNQ